MTSNLKDPSTRIEETAWHIFKAELTDLEQQGFAIMYREISLDYATRKFQLDIDIVKDQILRPIRLHKDADGIMFWSNDNNIEEIKE